MSDPSTRAPDGMEFALAITVQTSTGPITQVLTHAGTWKVSSDAQQKRSSYPPGAGISVVLVPERKDRAA